MSEILTPMYHGTAEIIKIFDPARTGQGEDQYGSGFYFDSVQEHADTYARIALQEHRGSTPNVIKAELRFEHPIIIDAAEPTLECVSITSEQTRRILCHIPAFYDKNPETNPLGNYLASFWSNPPKCKSDFNRLIDKLIRDCYTDTNLRQLDFLCAAWPTEFRIAIHAVTGYDGVIINYPHSRQAVAWFPEQIRILDRIPCQGVSENKKQSMM